MEEVLTEQELNLAKRLAKEFKLGKRNALGLFSELTSLGVYPTIGNSFAERVAEQNIPSLLQSDLSKTSSGEEREEFLEILYTLAWEGAVNKYYLVRELELETTSIIDLWREAMLVAMEIGKSAWRLPYIAEPQEVIEESKRMIGFALNVEINDSIDHDKKETSYRENEVFQLNPSIR